jgi:hypothetical protein
MAPSAGTVHPRAFQQQAPSVVYRTYSPMDIEDIQRSAYIAGLLRERPFGNRGEFSILPKPKIVNRAFFSHFSRFL